MRGRSLAALALLAGCAQTPPPPLSVDPRVAVRPDAGVMVATPLTITTDATGITRATTIELRNPNAGVANVNCTTDWFDAAGQPIGGLTAIPTRISVPPVSAEFCQTVSPSPAARSFRVAVTPTL